VAKTRASRKILNERFEDDFIPSGPEHHWGVEDDFSRENDAPKKKVLMERIRKLEEENNEKAKILNTHKKQLDDALRALEEKEKKCHEMEILLKTMEANLHQMESERKKFLSKIEEYAREIADLQDRCAQYEEDLKNLTNQLKSRTHENILLNKENKDLQRTNNQLRETITLLEDKNSALEQELARAEPARLDMEKKYNRALESLRTEVKAKHQELLRVSKELSELKKAHQDLLRVNENLELELDMLNTTNISLQKKIEKLIFQNNVLERKLQNKLVRLVLALCALFGWNPERKMRKVGC